MSESYKVAMDLLTRVSDVVAEGNVMQEFENEVWVCLPREDWEWLQELGHMVREQ